MSIGEQLPREHASADVPVTPEQAAQEWRVVSGGLLRAMQASAEVREALTPFATSPVSPELAGQVVQAAVAVDPDLASVVARHGRLGRYFEQPHVADSAITPDLRHSKLNYEQTAQVLFDYGSARDVKLIVFGAELQGQGNDIVWNDQGEATLPSGTRILSATEDRAQVLELLNPANWHHRRQTRGGPQVGRASEVTVGNQAYMIKEQKTKYHDNTLKGGHRGDVPIEYEVRVAQLFNERGRLAKGDAQVDWERPVGCVIFPDQSQFALYYKESFEERGDAAKQVAADIISNRALYEEEFKALTLERLTPHFSDPLVQDAERFAAGQSDASMIAGYTRRLLTPWRREPVYRSLRFEEFARAKARSLAVEADLLYRDAQEVVGYYNLDTSPAVGYRAITRPGERARLEVFGYDFESFRPIEDRSRGIRGEMEAIGQIGTAIEEAALKEMRLNIHRERAKHGRS